MESLEKTPTVGGIFLQSYLTLAQLDPLPFHVFTIFFFYSLFLLANTSLVPLSVSFLGFSVCLFLLHTCTCTHMCTYLGHGETIRSYARFWEFRGRIQVSLLIKKVIPVRERKWSVNRTLFWVPKGLCMEENRSEWAGQSVQLRAGRQKTASGISDIWPHIWKENKRHQVENVGACTSALIFN